MTDISKILAARNAVLERNSTLRALSSPGSLDGKSAQNFAATLQNAIGATDTSVPALTVNPPSIVDGVKGTLTRVNAVLEQEDVVTESYERGETTDIASVMLMKARASVQFEATMQVRNKLLAAYKDIMNMPV
jgi:flagellar hook-basal body complex protein FliE